MRIPNLKLLLTVAAGSVCLGPAWAQEYQLVGRAAGGDSLYVTVLETADSVKTVRTRLVHATPLVFKELKNVAASVSVEHLDCKNMLRTTIRLEMYDNLELHATPVWTQDIKPGDSKPVSVDITASTAGTLMFKAVCLNRVSSVTTPPAAPGGVTPAVTVTTPPTVTVAPPAGQSPYLPPAAIPGPPTPVAGPPVVPATVVPSPQPQPQPQSPSPSPGPGEIGIANYRPFESSRFTLGLMGRLAEYIYFDQQTLEFHEAAANKIGHIKDTARQDGQSHPLLDEASKRLFKRWADYRERMSLKNALVQQQQLKAVRLPALPLAAPKAFRAELYQHAPSGEYILVFRGTQEPSDWLTNAWAGIDFMSIEAPHYRAAFDLVTALRKQRIAPLVTGHSLGGGLAQFVGYKFGLKVVGFNSAPLPHRYFTDGAGAAVQHIRLFSAIEFIPQQGTPQPVGNPDPVSISIPNAAAHINNHFPANEPVKAHELMVKPICVRSVPDPMYTVSEQEGYAALVNRVLTRGVVSAIVGGFVPRPGAVATDMALVQAIRSKIGNDMSGPLWRPDKLPNVNNQAVVDAVKHEVTQVAVDAYRMAGGMTNLAKGGYKFSMGNSMMDTLSGMGTLGAAVGKAMAARTVAVRYLQPHSMERFNRGMLDVAGSDVFLADPVRAQCSTQATLY